MRTTLLWIPCLLVCAAPLLSGCGGGSEEALADPLVQRTFVYTTLFETDGRVGDPQLQPGDLAVDTRIVATYVGGLSGLPAMAPGGSVQVALYLHDLGAQAQPNAANVVYPPILFTLDEINRSKELLLQDVMAQHGTVPSQFITPCAVIVCTPIDGGDVDLINFDTFITNSHTSPFTVAPITVRPLVFDAPVE